MARAKQSWLSILRSRTFSGVRRLRPVWRGSAPRRRSVATAGSNEQRLIVSLSIPWDLLTIYYCTFRLNRRRPHPHSILPSLEPQPHIHASPSVLVPQIPLTHVTNLVENLLLLSR